MKWEILILTMPERKEFLRQLLEVLEPQIAALGLNKFDHIDVRVREHIPGLSYGGNRQLMRERSTGDYINFIDDDDLIAKDYVVSILPLLDGIHQVGFRVQGYMNYAPMKRTYHSLSHGRWYEDAKGYYRDISHICPMRRELALAEPMEGGYGEDSRWADRLRARGIVQSESFVKKTLYHYLIREPKQDIADAADPRREAFMQSL